MENGSTFDAIKDIINFDGMHPQLRRLINKTLFRHYTELDAITDMLETKRKELEAGNLTDAEKRLKTQELLALKKQHEEKRKLIKRLYRKLVEFMKKLKKATDELEKEQKEWNKRFDALDPDSPNYDEEFDKLNKEYEENFKTEKALDFEPDKELFKMDDFK